MRLVLPLLQKSMDLSSMQCAAPSGVLEHPGTLKDPSKVRDSWSQTFGGSSNSHKVAVLEEGMKYTPISISPNEAQFLETRKFSNR